MTKAFRDMTPEELDEAEALYRATLASTETVKERLSEFVKTIDVDARVKELKAASQPFINFAKATLATRNEIGMAGLADETPVLIATTSNGRMMVVWKDFTDLLFAVEKRNPLT